jgi:hypothetical protein
LVLFEVHNVAVVTIDEFGDGGIQALAVETLHQEYCGVFHQKPLRFPAQLYARMCGEKALRLHEGA